MAGWPAEQGIDADELFRLTGGNPFFVSEVLAFPEQTVPPTIVDAVLARFGALDADVAGRRRPAVRRARPVSSSTLLRRLVDDLEPVGEAERAGVLEVRGDAGRRSGTSWPGARSTSR